MPSKEVAINDAFRHLYILEPPTCRTKDVTQYRRILRADVIRNKIRMYPNAPHGIYLVDDDGTSATHSQQLFHFFDGPDIEEALAQTRAAASGGDTQTVTGRTTEETLLRQGSSRPQARPTYNPQRRNASVSHASVDSPGVPDQDVQPPMRDTQGIIYVKDENALMPLALSGRGPITTPAS
ncbi:hypothetical protein C8Q78DRAFT_1077928 [Trametes maxima]|nr:hypothetical protein C8Q78DRAFT_1077928 [Trametes maxima]